MPSGAGEIGFDHKGIGHALSDNRMVVPINQRSYAWEDEHVTDLFQDFASAIASDDPDYFLGTIVLTAGENSVPEVSDGQQRLATTSILIAAIRDYLFSHGHQRRAVSIHGTYLSTTDLRTEEEVPRLQLNSDDKEYFIKRIISMPGDPERNTPARKYSNERIDRAAKLAMRHVENLIAPFKESDRVARLIDWIEFIKSNAKVIIVRVPDHINAFTMFETLNDRGLRIAQSDLLKNYFFGRSGDRLSEIYPLWASMTGALETVGDPDIAVDYIRHMWITRHGPTRERDLSKAIKEKINSKQKTVDFVTLLSAAASDYVAILNPDSAKWNDYGNATRKHLRTIHHHLKVEQIRPLLLAIANKFPVAEAQKAFRMCVCWSVRFLVFGGRGGFLDTNYGRKAQQVGTGEISTASELADAMAEIVPNDAQFQSAFAAARVSQNYLARYYLRALELTVKEDDEPELIPNEDQESVNLEHVLPQNPGEVWGIDPETASANCRRIGNLCLMRATQNSTIGSSSFDSKKPAYAASGYELTKMIAAEGSWGLQEISDRQAKLAEYAVSTWPIRHD